MVKVVFGYGYISGGRGGVHDGEGDIVMVRVMSMMFDMLSLMVGVVSMTAEENVWESGEEKMTLLPEAVGAGMWKPEYEFPGMHCTKAKSCHAEHRQQTHAGSSHSTMY